MYTSLLLLIVFSVRRQEKIQKDNTRLLYMFLTRLLTHERQLARGPIPSTPYRTKKTSSMTNDCLLVIKVMDQMIKQDENASAKLLSMNINNVLVVKPHNNYIHFRSATNAM